MNYGFLIRNDRCIGCHACSTACKSENDVPLGVQRTWVKSVETGVYPNVRRHFQVTRCNHCSNPPCVRICPVTAMYQRDDGIVEFDPEVCIGCKACMQACPYDAIYVDPDTHTAAKCHYCAHRVEMNLEPACVVVCPEHAIIAGDMDDASSEISRMLAEFQVTVRKPEQGTAPKLFYVDGDDANLTPTAVERTPATFAWADVVAASEDQAWGAATPPSKTSSRRSTSGASLRAAQHQGVPDAGPIMIGNGRMAEQMIQVAYNAQHKIPWHWPVPAYLVTKAIGTGLFMLLAVGYGLGAFAFELTSFVAAGFGSLLFIALTTALLVLDLERPERFFTILTRPQWKSWLTRGAFLLIGFTGVAGFWWILEAGAFAGFWNPINATFRMVLMWAGLPLAVGAAIYTAFLFGQAEGRDLWQSTLLPIHLVVQAFMAGAGAFLILDLFLGLPAEMVSVARLTFGMALGIDLAVVIAGEFGMPHASEAAARAAKMISNGRYRWFYWTAIVGGHVLPLVLLFVPSAVAAALAGLLAVAGLYLYEHAFVMAPQRIPNS